MNGCACGGICARHPTWPIIFPPHPSFAHPAHPPGTAAQGRVSIRPHASTAPAWSPAAKRAAPLCFSAPASAGAMAARSSATSAAREEAAASPSGSSSLRAAQRQRALHKVLCGEDERGGPYRGLPAQVKSSGVLLQTAKFPPAACAAHVVSFDLGKAGHGASP